MVDVGQAQIWRQAGCAVFPIATDRTKRPAISEWHPYHHAPADEAIVTGWYTARNLGLAIACGAGSGNLEMLEFEGIAVDEGIHNLWEKAVDEAGYPGLVHRVAGGYLERSPKGGLHLFYRVADMPVPGNAKLAQRPRPGTERPDALIETRGQGGYVIVAPTGPECSGADGPYEPWVALAGHPSTIVTITAAERDAMHAAARMLDTYREWRDAQRELLRPAAPPAGTWTPGTGGDDRPGTLWAARTPWRDILEPHGWKLLYAHGGKEYWRRPDKEGRQVGATTTEDGATGLGGMYVFTSSTVLPTEEPLNKISVYARLNHHGNYGDMADALGWRTGPQQEPLTSIGAAPEVPDGPAPVPLGKPGDDEFERRLSEFEAKLLTADELDAIPRPAPLVAGLVYAGEVGQIIGKSSSMKSFAALDMAGCVGSGIPWQGRVTKRTRTLYVLAEGASGITARVRAWEKHYGQPMAGVVFIPEPVQVASRRGRDIAPSTDWLLLTEVVKRGGYGLVILDTQARSTVGVQESDNTEMGQVFEFVDRTRRTTGASVIFIHHIGKNGEQGRGASSMYGAMNMELTVERKRDSVGSTIIIRNTKNKDSAEGDDIFLAPSVVQLDGVFDADGNIVTSLVLIPTTPRSGLSADAPIDRAPAHVAAAVRAVYALTEETGASVTTAQVATLTLKGPANPSGTMAKATLYRALNMAVSAGWLDKSGAQLRLTAAGLESIGPMRIRETPPATVSEIARERVERSDETT